MITCANDKISNQITNLVYTILDDGIYPKTWGHGLIVLILFRDGNKSEPTNYRGITIDNNLSKLFSVCIQKWIQDFLEKENILSPSQAGFRKKRHRTTDHIFTLFALIKKFVKKNKYLYTCFADFSKAYDSIQKTLQNGCFW